MTDGSIVNSKPTSFTSSFYCRCLVVLAVIVILSIIIGLSIGLGVYYGRTKSVSLANNIKSSGLRQLLVVSQNKFLYP